MWEKAKSTVGRIRLWQLPIVFVLLFLVLIVVARAQSGDGTLMSPDAGYDLSWWTVDGGGSTSSTGGGYYDLGGTIGQPDVGISSADGYALTGGFWPGIVESEQTPALYLVWLKFKYEGETLTDHSDSQR